MSRTLRAAACGLLASLATSSCAVESVNYVAGKRGYAQHVGTITRLEGVRSDDLVRLSDGIAIELSGPGQAALLFDEATKKSRVFDLDAGDILVFGEHRDYILEPYPSPPAPAPKASGPRTEASEP